ncbi:hypothetical protein LUZ60_012973 [Juncus effusus]|nr:hypothetical protein LUZ60_012973 [Juncus effusus]
MPIISPFTLYAITWTSIVTFTVAIAAFAPELAFVWSVSPAGRLTNACQFGKVGLPMEGPVWEKICLPLENFGRTKADVFIPPIFAVTVVAGSVCIMRAIGLWEDDEEEES